MEIFEKIAFFCNFFEKNCDFRSIIVKNGNFLTIFGHLNVNFPEGQLSSLHGVGGGLDITDLTPRVKKIHCWLKPGRDGKPLSHLTDL